MDNLEKEVQMIVKGMVMAGIKSATFTVDEAWIGRANFIGYYTSTILNHKNYETMVSIDKHKVRYLGKDITFKVVKKMV